MGLLDIFRAPPPIRDPEALAEFIDRNAAFLAQKGIYEYSRARAGHYAKVLFGEPEFIAAIEQSRWAAYPLCLAMIVEVVEGVLRAHGDDRRRVLDALIELSLTVFDRYPVSAALGDQAWSDARRELARRLDLIGIHAVKWAKDVPEPFAQSYFDLMPIHEKLRARDFPAIKNYLKVTLCNVHDEFSRRTDVPALVQLLLARRG
jgi:hypothetical protein